MALVHGSYVVRNAVMKRLHYPLDVILLVCGLFAASPRGRPGPRYRIPIPKIERTMVNRRSQPLAVWPCRVCVHAKGLSITRRGLEATSCVAHLRFSCDKVADA
jgi:hypothetical protein